MEAKKRSEQNGPRIVSDLQRSEGASDGQRSCNQAQSECAAYAACPTQGIGWPDSGRQNSKGWPDRGRHHSKHFDDRPPIHCHDQKRSTDGGNVSNRSDQREINNEHGRGQDSKSAAEKRSVGKEQTSDGFEGDAEQREVNQRVFDTKPGIWQNSQAGRMQKQAEARLQVQEQYSWFAPRVIFRWIDTAWKTENHWEWWTIDSYDGMGTYHEWKMILPRRMSDDKEVHGA